MAGPPSIATALRSLSASLVAVGRTRLELFGVEFSEQKANAMRAGILAAVGLLCIAMAAAVLTAFVAVIFWETEYRLLAVGLLGLAWLIAGGLCLWSVMRSVENVKHPFALTLAELERDYEVLTSPLADPNATTAEKRAVVTRNTAASTAPDAPTDEPGSPT